MIELGEFSPCKTGSVTYAPCENRLQVVCKVVRAPLDDGERRGAARPDLRCSSPHSSRSKAIHVGRARGTLDIRATEVLVVPLIDGVRPVGWDQEDIALFNT